MDIKFKGLIACSLFALAGVAIAATISTSNGLNAQLASGTLGSSEIHSDTLAITDMATIKSDSVYTKDGNKITFSSYNGLNDFSEAGKLSNGATLFNQTIVNGLTSVTVVSEGQIKILAGWYQSGSASFAFNSTTPVATGTGTVVADFGTSSAGYFAIVADGEDAVLSSVSLNYACVETTHSFTVNLYSINTPNTDNKAYLLFDTNYSINDDWINGKADWDKPMEYHGTVTSGGETYHHFSYTVTAVPFGLERFQFVARDSGDAFNKTLSASGDWSAYWYYMKTSDTNVTLYCYADDGFPEVSGTNTFSTYNSELTNPYKTTFNVTFADGSSAFSYVGIKTDLSGSYSWSANLSKTDNTWSVTLNSGETQDYHFFIEVWADGFNGNAQLVKSTSPWSGFNINITDSKDVAVVDIVVGSAITSAVDYVVTPTATNCTIS